MRRVQITLSTAAVLVAVLTASCAQPVHHHPWDNGRSDITAALATPTTPAHPG
jgi:hypothetical protein